jgi:hypothetical protein
MSAFDKWDVIRTLFGVALALCNVGVWRGVSLEESHLEGLKEAGKRLLIVSLALEALFAFALLAVDTTASVIQKREIAALNAEIAPRRLSSEDIAALKAAVRPYADRQISVWSYGTDVEARVLAAQILHALNDEHVPTVDSIGHMVSSTTLRVGVIITGPDEALIGALMAALKPVSPTRGSLNNPGAYSKSGVDMLYGNPGIVPAEIFVGVKPIKE